MRIILATIVVMLALAGKFATAAEPVLTITGTGTVSAPPDIATVTTAVEVNGDTAVEALAANSAAMARVIETLRAAGVAERDIQTSGLSVQPVYGDSKLRSYGSDTPEIDHYRVYNGVTVIVRDLAGLGGALDAVVKSGANRINGIGFGFAEPGPLRNEARGKAVADARATAQIYAEATGVRLGRILSISEFGGGPPMPMAAMARAESAVPIATGESGISASVQIVWEIVNPE